MMQTLVQRHTQLVNKVQVRVDRSRKAMQVYHGGLVLEHRGLVLDISEALWVKPIHNQGHEEELKQDTQQSQEDTP